MRFLMLLGVTQFWLHRRRDGGAEARATVLENGLDLGRIRAEEPWRDLFEVLLRVRHLLVDGAVDGDGLRLLDSLALKLPEDADEARGHEARRAVQ